MTGNGNYTTHKNADDWGMVYGIVLTTLHSILTSPTGVQTNPEWSLGMGLSTN